MPKTINNTLDTVSSLVTTLLKTIEQRKSIEAQEEFLREQIQEICNSENLKKYEDSNSTISISERITIKPKDEKTAIAYLLSKNLSEFTTIIPQHHELDITKLKVAIDNDLISQEDANAILDIKKTQFLTIKAK